MTTYNTGNPIGSTDARDRLDNSENMDILENSTTLNAHTDRLGVVRKTRKGMELEHDNQISAHEIEHDAQMQSFESDFDSRLAGMAFTRVGTFTTGATLTDMRQTLLWELSQGGDGREYGWTGSFLPAGKVVAAGSLPTPVSAGNWVDRTDDRLRSDLLSGDGAYKVGVGLSTVGGVIGNNFLKYGAVPDYSGTPLYDGADSTRITHTDNTPALLDALVTNPVIENDILYLHIPRGHYGFSGNKITITPATVGYSKIIITGDGRDNTILDYIKEDNTGTDAHEQGDGALELLRFETGFAHVEFRNITCKCTTKRGFVNGTPSSAPDNEAIYHGTVWFAHIKQASKVVMHGVIAEYANYRCISIDGSSALVPAVTELEMTDCVGRHNTGSGFWVRGVYSAIVTNCFGYRNGNIGVTATGYGIAFSQYCSGIKIIGGAFFENYRKGIDKHGGVGTVELIGVLVADNIIMQISQDQQYNDLYDAALTTEYITDNVFIVFGLNRDFCNAAISAISIENRNHISVLMNDRKIDGTPANRLGNANLNGCNFYFLQGLTSKFESYVGVSSMAGQTVFDKSTMDLTYLNINKATNKTVYSFTPFTLGKESSTLVIRESSLQLGDGYVFNQSAVPSNSVFCTLPNTSKVIFEDSTYDLKNFVLLGVTGAGLVSPFTGPRKINGNTFKIRDLQTFCFSRTISPSIEWLRSNYFFKPSSYSNYGASNKIGLGDCNYLIDHHVGVNAKSSEFKIPLTTVTAGATVQILTGNQYGNIQLDMQGMASHASEKYSAWWEGSSNTHRLLTSATTISASAALGDYTVQYNGNPTNFILKSITITFSGTIINTGFWKGILTAQADDVLTLAGIVK